MNPVDFLKFSHLMSYFNIILLSTQVRPIHFFHRDFKTKFLLFLHVFVLPSGLTEHCSSCSLYGKYHNFLFKLTACVSRSEIFFMGSLLCAINTPQCHFRTQKSSLHPHAKHRLRCRFPGFARLSLELHGSESFLRSQQALSYSRNSPHFMKPECSSPYSQDPATCHYPEPVRSSLYPPIQPIEDPS